MFNLTVIAYIRNLTNLRTILEKAKVWQSEKKISDETMVNARIALDQFSFGGQVSSVTNYAKTGAAALCGVKYPVFEDNEKSLDDLIRRIDATVAFLKTLTSEMVKGDLETRMIPVGWAPGKGFIAKYYVETFSLSNFYFHYTTAYSILRHYGLEIGKADFMGSIDLRDLV